MFIFLVLIDYRGEGNEGRVEDQGANDSWFNEKTLGDRIQVKRCESTLWRS